MKAQAKISEYDQQAIDFLESTGTTLKVDFLYTGQYFHTDTEERDIYQFTLTNARGTYSSKFGDSLNNTKIREFCTRKRALNYKEDYSFCKANGIKISEGSGYVHAQKPKVPGAYDILSCLDSYCPDTFEDFCDEYGYSDQPLTEHDNIMRVFMNVRDQSKGLRAMFTPEQLEQLAEIA